METSVVNNPNLEKSNFITKIIRVITLPILNNLPKSILRKMAKSSSRDASKILDKVGSAHALEVMYTRHKRKLFSRGLMQGLADFYWHHILSQLKAVRNRLKIVEDNLEAEIARRANLGEKELSLLTVGGGSSRAIIQTIYRMKNKYPEVIFKVTNIDKDEKAIELGKEIADEYLVGNAFNWINSSASHVAELIDENSIDIAEMVGLMDYFYDPKAATILNQIYTRLKSEGLLIVANVTPNPEMYFVESVGWPKMCYRTLEDFRRVLRKAGFLENFSLVIEPLKVHIIALARK